MGVSVKGEFIPNISHSVAIFRGKVTFSTMQKLGCITFEMGFYYDFCDQQMVGNLRW
jgi:hypothetical protein